MRTNVEMLSLRSPACLQSTFPQTDGAYDVEGASHSAASQEVLDCRLFTAGGSNHGRFNIIP